MVEGGHMDSASLDVNTDDAGEQAALPLVARDSTIQVSNAL
jgi:hypothetical protein